MEEQGYAMKPDNNMALAIFTTICCCLPLGIVAIIKANSVDSLFAMKQYEAAQMAANEAKKWSTIGIVCGLIGGILYIILMAVAGGLGAMAQ